MYARVPAINGVPQVGLAKLIFGVSISDTEAICEIEGELQEGWTEIAQAEFEAVCPPSPVIEEPPQPTEIQILLGKITALEAKVDAMRGDVTTIKTNVVATKTL